MNAGVLEYQIWGLATEGCKAFVGVEGATFGNTLLAFTGAAFGETSQIKALHAMVDWYENPLYHYTKTIQRLSLDLGLKSIDVDSLTGQRFPVV